MSPINNHERITIERRFDITTTITQDWFRSYVSELSKYTRAEGSVTCDTRTAPDRENRIEFRNRDAWSDYVLANWHDVVETTFRQSDATLRRAYCNHRRQHVVLTIEAEDALRIEQIFEILCQALSLKVSPYNPYKYRRSSIEFEVGNWRPDLFVSGVKSIAAMLGPNPDLENAFAKSFDGEIEKLTPFYDLGSFCEGIGTRASRFGEIVIQMRARSISVGLGVTSDHKKLRIRTSLPPTEVDSFISAWPNDLKLKQVKAVDTGAEVGGTVPPLTESLWLKYGIPVVVAFITAISTAGLVTLKKAVWPDYKVMVVSPSVNGGIAKWNGKVVSIEWYLQPEQTSFRPPNKTTVANVRIDSGLGSPQILESRSPLSVSLNPGTYVVVIDSPDASPAQFQLIIEPASTQPNRTPLPQ
jgi:hypothetical protein